MTQGCGAAAHAVPSSTSSPPSAAASPRRRSTTASRADGRAVGVASVYRALDTLAALRLVQRVDVGDGVARFEPAAGSHHHHHLVCEDCGKVEPFTDEPLERALKGAAGRLGYAMEQHEVVLRGSCSGCL